MLFLWLFIKGIVSQTFTGPCTYHDYEGDRQRLGLAYDTSPGWCGIRYSVLNVARITAVHGLGTGMCNQCLEMQGIQGGPKVYVLAVDQKGGAGLDVAPSSFQAAFPGANILDPQTCSWRIVAPELCGTICYGSVEECTPGVRNLLPATLLPSISPAPIGFNIVGNKPTVTTTRQGPTATTTIVIETNHIQGSIFHTYGSVSNSIATTPFSLFYILAYLL